MAPYGILNIFEVGDSVNRFCNIRSSYEIAKEESDDIISELGLEYYNTTVVDGVETSIAYVSLGDKTIYSAIYLVPFDKLLKYYIVIAVGKQFMFYPNKVGQMYDSKDDAINACKMIAESYDIQWEGVNIIDGNYVFTTKDGKEVCIMIHIN